jgi:hypothetical protein
MRSRLDGARRIMNIWILCALMLALSIRAPARTDKWYFAHPALWAPFVVVGEGNAEWAGRR